MDWQGQQGNKENEGKEELLHYGNTDEQLSFFQLIDPLHGKELEQGGQASHGCNNTDGGIRYIHGQHEGNQEGSACQLGNRLIGRIPRYVVPAALFIIPFVFGKGHKINPAQPSKQPGEIKHNPAHKIPRFPRPARPSQVLPSA